MGLPGDRTEVLCGVSVARIQILTTSWCDGPMFIPPQGLTTPGFPEATEQNKLPGERSPTRSSPWKVAGQGRWPLLHGGRQRTA